jgi:hypothetical protein
LAGTHPPRHLRAVDVHNHRAGILNEAWFDRLLIVLAVIIGAAIALFLSLLRGIAP